MSERSRGYGFIDGDGGIFINQSKYALESLKKYGFEFCDPVDTPKVEKSKLDEDNKGKAVYPSHFMARPTEMHLHTVKRTFRYLRGTVNWGLWYPNDSSIALTAFTYADHAGCQDTRRSTSGSLQFLGDKLISWSSKRKKSAAISNTEAKYIALTMDMIFDQQVALDEALVPHAFLITADVPEIYMQEFWATATVHHHSIRFKMDNKKRIFNLEYFREMLHICPRLPGQTFDELLFKEEIMEFLRFLGHSGEIRKLTDAQDSRSTTKGKHPAKSSKSKCLIVFSEVAMTEVEQWKLATKRSLQQTHISQASGSGADEGTGIIPGVPDDDDDQDDNDDDQDTDNDGEDFVHPKLSIHEEEAKDEESFNPVVQTSKNSDDEGDDDACLGLNVGGIDSLFETTPWVDIQASTTVAPLTLTAPTLPPSTIPTISQFGRAVSFILMIVERYMDQRMNEAKKVAVQIQSDKLRDEAQAENEEFLKNLDENIQKIIKEQVKEQVKVQVSKILSKIEKTVNEKLEAKVLTRSSNSSKTSYVVAADLSEMELKKILIEKIKSNKSIHRSDEQRNLYKALVDAYESDKIILDTYRDTVTLKRCHDDADKNEEPFAGSDRGSKRRRDRKEPESTSAPKEKATKTTGKSTQGSKSHQKTASESAPAEEPMQITQDLEEPSHQEFETSVADNQPITESSQHPEWFQQQKKPPTLDPFLMNRLKVDTLTLELLAGPTYELMKGSCKNLVELEFFLEEVYKATTDQLDWNNPEGQRYPHNLLKPLPLIPNSRGRHVIPFDHFINNDLEYLRGGASNRKDDDKLYKFKEGDFKRLRIQDIKDMLLLLVQGKLTNLTVEEYFAFNVSLRMFTRSIVIQRRVEDLQLCVKSYQKKLNLTKPDTYCFSLKRKEAYTAYSNPRGIIYQNKDKQSRLMWINELHKFSDETLNDVRTALDDRL
nr:hypothetical protein [Tanacetum cinerariifolium]